MQMAYNQTQSKHNKLKMSVYNSVDMEVNRCEQVFNGRFEYNKSLHPLYRKNGVYSKGNIIMVHYESKDRKIKIDYIGRIKRVYVETLYHKTAILLKGIKQEINMIDLEILWERHGQTYKSPRFAKKQPKWVPHTKGENLNINTQIVWKGTLQVGDVRTIKYHMGFCKTYIIQRTIKDKVVKFLREELIDSHHFKNNKVTKKNQFAVLYYSRVPNIADYLDIDRLINEDVGPHQLAGHIKQVFDKFPYDVYRNIMGYM